MDYATATEAGFYHSKPRRNQTSVVLMGRVNVQSMGSNIIHNICRIFFDDLEFLLADADYSEPVTIG